MRFNLGAWKEEEQLPSTTVLSQQYCINVVTINKALAILIDEGLVYKKRGIGRFLKKVHAQGLLKKEERDLNKTSSMQQSKKQKA